MQNIIQFPLQRGIPMRVKTTRSSVEKRLKEVFDNHLEFRLQVALYSEYLKATPGYIETTNAAREEKGTTHKSTLSHVVGSYSQSSDYDVNQYRLCFMTLGSYSIDQWSINDYWMVLSLVLSLPEEMFLDSYIRTIRNDLFKKIGRAKGAIDRLFQIEIKRGN